MHNFADALTAVPPAIAFSAALAGYEAVKRLIDPQDVQALGWVVGAGFVGFLGNELAARYRIKVGREIGSAALVADGLHARTDGFTSLAVLIGAGGAALGFPIADPIVGLLITAAMCFVLRDAAREVYHRLMDAVDPALVEQAEQALAQVPGVKRVGSVRLRWIGHALRAEVDIQVDHKLSLVEAHDVPRLRAATVHADPYGPAGADHHAALASHR